MKYVCWKWNCAKMSSKSVIALNVGREQVQIWILYCKNVEDMAHEAINDVEVVEVLVEVLDEMLEIVIDKWQLGNGQKLQL